MASQSTYEYYRDDPGSVPPLRAVAETLLQSEKVRKVTAAEAYELARGQWDVMETDMPIYPPAAKRLGLPAGAKILNNTHGKIIGRTAKARRFYNRMPAGDQDKVTKDLREAVSDLQKRPLIKGEGIVGLDRDLMIKATIIGAEDDAANIFNWLANFTPYEELAAEYRKSPVLPIQDILVIGDNQWRNDDPFYHNQGFPQLALVDEQCNVIYNFGMRYFGERKKGTLTLAWTSGMRIGMAACHGGIKEMDFTRCEDERARKLGKRSIAFFGLSGTGKSSHTNSLDNAGTIPAGTTKVVLHDDAFQIDCEDKVCRVWEPSLFDKTDQRSIDHPEWKYCLTVMNCAVVAVDGQKKILGLEVRNANGRALYDRDMTGDWVNRCRFPEMMVWLMKDTCLPPILKFENTDLGVAMGAALITKRNKAENVSEEELKKLVFEPFANPFRVYELWKDIEAFGKVFENGAACYCMNSAGMWKKSDEEVNDIPLTTSLTLQTAILTDRLDWEPWKTLPGALIPTKASIEKLLPGFYDRYHPNKVGNKKGYLAMLKDRFKQRRDFLKSTDVKEKPELLKRLGKALTIRSS